MSIVLAGARGRMGRMLMTRAHQAGLHICGLDLPYALEDTAAKLTGANLVILCVPAAALGETLAHILPHLSKKAVLADITSVKEEPMRQMERAFAGAVVGTHPLFGPAPEAGHATGTDLPVVITPGTRASQEHIALVEGFFTALGCRTFRSTAEQHDKAMARIQGMNFISSLAYFALLAGDEELLPFLTPSFRRRQAAACKLLTEDAELFAGLFEANPHSHEAVRLYRRMLNLAAAGDIDLLCHKAQWWWPEGCSQ